MVSVRYGCHAAHAACCAYAKVKCIVARQFSRHDAAECFLYLHDNLRDDYSAGEPDPVMFSMAATADGTIGKHSTSRRNKPGSSVPCRACNGLDGRSWFGAAGAVRSMLGCPTYHKHAPKTSLTRWFLPRKKEQSTHCRSF
jgi:hypothetical protein